MSVRALAGGPIAAVAETPAALEALAPEWRALEAATPEATGFQGEGWCRAWRQASAVARFGARPRAVPRVLPRVVTVREEGRLVALLPLSVDRRVGLRTARWLAEPLTQYGDALALPSGRREAWFAAAWALVRTWRDVDVIELARVRDDAVIAAHLPRGEGVSEPSARRGAGPRGPEFLAPHVDLLGTAGGGRSGRTLRSLRRRLKRLEAIGPAHFRVLTPGEGEGAERRVIAGECLRLKAAWLRARGLHSAGLGHRAAEAALLAAAEAGDLALAALEVGGRVAAAEIGLVGGSPEAPAGGRRYGSFLTGYDPVFAAGAPSQVLTLHLFEALAERGFATYDFLPPADEYKLEWASGGVPLRHHRLALTLAGRAVGALADLRPTLKRGYYSLPPALRGLRTRLRAP